MAASPVVGQQVRVRRFTQPGLAANHPRREPAGEWTGIAIMTDSRGLCLSPGPGWLDTDWVPLGDGSYLVTEVEVLADLPEDDELEEVPDHRNDLGDWCPRSGERTGDGTCPLYCHEADVLVGFDAGDRELPDSTDLPPELWPPYHRANKENQ
jgi:hypothetical protein